MLRVLVMDYGLEDAGLAKEVEHAGAISSRC